MLGVATAVFIYYSLWTLVMVRRHHHLSLLHLRDQKQLHNPKRHSNPATFPNSPINPSERIAERKCIATKLTLPL
jgi:hypothetical protein